MCQINKNITDQSKQKLQKQRERANEIKKNKLPSGNEQNAGNKNIASNIENELKKNSVKASNEIKAFNKLSDGSDFDGEMDQISNDSSFLNQSNVAQLNASLLNTSNDDLAGNLKKSITTAKQRQARRLALASTTSVYSDKDLSSKSNQRVIHQNHKIFLRDAVFASALKEFDRFFDSFAFVRKQMESNPETSAPARDLRLFRLLEPYTLVINKVSAKYENDRDHMPAKYRAQFAYLEELRRRYDTYLQYPEAERARKISPYSTEEMEVHNRNLQMKAKICAKMGVANTDETVEKQNYNPIDENTLTALHECDKWLVRNLNHSTHHQHGAFIANILSLSDRERLFVYYVIEHKKRHTATGGDVTVSQTAYMPNANNFRDIMRAARFRIFRRLRRDYIYWNKLEDAVNILNKNRSHFDAYLAPHTDVKQVNLSSGKMLEDDKSDANTLKENDPVGDELNDLLNLSQSALKENKNLDDNSEKSNAIKTEIVSRMNNLIKNPNAKLNGASGSTWDAKQGAYAADAGDFQTGMFLTVQTALGTINNVLGDNVKQTSSQLMALTNTETVEKAIEYAQNNRQNEQIASVLDTYNKQKSTSDFYTNISNGVNAGMSIFLIMGMLSTLKELHDNWHGTAETEIAEKTTGLLNTALRLTNTYMAFSKYAAQPVGTGLGIAGAGLGFAVSGAQGIKALARCCHRRSALKEINSRGTDEQKAEGSLEKRLIHHSDRLNGETTKAFWTGSITSGTILGASLAGLFATLPLTIGIGTFVALPVGITLLAKAIDNKKQLKREAVSEKLGLSDYIAVNGQQLTKKARQKILHELVRESANMLGCSSTTSLYNSIVAKEAADLRQKLFYYNGVEITQEYLNQKPGVKDYLKPYISLANSYGLDVNYKENANSQTEATPALSTMIAKMS